MSTPPSVEEVVARRRREQAARVQLARAYAARLPAHLEVRAVVVFGSVARGDFHDSSDIDVLVIAEQLPTGAVERLAAVGSPTSDGVEAWPWTPAEWRARLAEGDPAAAEAAARGIWLVGDPRALGDTADQEGLKQRGTPG